MKILLLSAYDAASHKRWREQLVRHLDNYEWTVLALPPRNFAWRSRGNALTWARNETDILTAGYDHVLATSMVDLAGLRGLIPEISQIPTAVYFHENQFAYPERLERKEGQNYQLTNIFTALAADRVLFNSQYNRQSMLDGIRTLLRMMPDCIPSGVLETVEDRSEVIPVPLEDHCYLKHVPAADGSPLTLVWNHRWEHDKAPERFFRVMFELVDRDIPFRVHIMWQRFRDCPPIFEQARERLRDQIITWGYVSDEERYRRILSTSDVIISTSLHDFQGLAVLEAVAAGCVPLVPDRLAYRELFEDRFRFPSLPKDAERESEGLLEILVRMCADPRSVRETSPPPLDWLSWKRQSDAYIAVLEEK
ncbi:DUF3524 domain-containing protein [bacterium]|nr:MAG: DUF3524 domain-containing protein [bacterium]